MSGLARQCGIIILLTLLAAATVFCSSPRVQAGTCFNTAPPTNYWRQIEFRTVDLSGRPLSGVAVQMNVYWGDLGLQRSYLTGENGVVVIPVKPVVENTTEGKRIRDRFLGYRLWLDYCLAKPGYVPVRACLKDHQEYACFSDPLYQGLNKAPDDKPLLIPVTMHAYCDYLDCPDEPAPSQKSGTSPTTDRKTGAKKSQGKSAKKEKKETIRCRELVHPLRELVRQLVNATQDRYSLQPGAIKCLPDDGLKVGLDFNLMFDPSQMGLQAAAKVLLQDVVSPVSAMLNQALGAGYFAFYQIDIQASFQYEKSPHDIPAFRTITYKIPASAIGFLAGCSPDGPLPYDDIEIKAGNIPILLDR